jgi:hypothetical protein
VSQMGNLGSPLGNEQSPWKGLLIV